MLMSQVRPQIARNLSKRRPAPRSMWHLDEMVVSGRQADVSGVSSMPRAGNDGLGGDFEHYLACRMGFFAIKHAVR